MKSQTATALILAIILLTDVPAVSSNEHPRCCCCGSVSTLVGTASTIYGVYRTYRCVEWVWRFVEYLEKEHQRLLRERNFLLVPEWLFENPPPCGRYSPILQILKYILSEETTKVLKRYSFLQDMSCNNEHCNAVKQILKYV